MTTTKTTTSKRRPRSKKFLGQVLKKVHNFNNVWMNDDKPGEPFVCLSRKGTRGTWTVITVGVAGHKFEGEGSTERKARKDFTNRLGMLKQAITLIDQWSERK